MAKGRKTGGRVHGYPKNTELVDAALRFVANGGTLHRWFRDNNPPFDMSTLFDWFQDVEGLGERYARAKDRRCAVWAEETMEIADDGTNDWTERTARDGSTYEVVNREVIERSKLRIAQRNYERERWASAKAAKSASPAGTSLETIFAAIAAVEALKAAVADHGRSAA